MGLVTGGEVLRCGGAGRRPPRRRWKTGELLDAGGARRRPLSVPWRRRDAWARGQCENVWREREQGVAEERRDFGEEMGIQPRIWRLHLPRT